MLRMSTLVGSLRTISDRRRWELETEEFGVIGLDAGDIAPEVVAGLHVGQLVEVVATMRTLVKPGGDETREYTALRVSDKGR